MPYCTRGQTAVLKYKFPEKELDKFTTVSTPLDVIVRQTNKTGYMPGAYQADYHVDNFSFTGPLISTGHYQPYAADTGNQTLINTPNKYYYPPFDYPIFLKNGIYYSVACDYRNARGEKLRGYFNLGGSHERPDRDKFVVRDIKWIREDAKPEIFKYEIVVTDSNGNQQFIDYGIGEPSFQVLCESGKCPVGSCECDCGDVICCYGSDGQVLKTISK